MSILFHYNHFTPTHLEQSDVDGQVCYSRNDDRV